VHQQIGEQIDAGPLEATVSIGGQSWRTVEVVGTKAIIGNVELHGHEEITVRVDDGRGTLAGWRVTGATSVRTEVRWRPSVRLTEPATGARRDAAPRVGGGPSGISSEAVAGAVRTLTPRHPQVLCSAAAGGGAGSFTCAAQISLTQTADGVGPPTMILSIGAP